MPPRTRTKAAKILKENNAERKKPDVKNTKQTRKALADKTNSLSDDNASIDIPLKTKKTALNNFVAEVNSNLNHNGRPRRERRLPGRFVENEKINIKPNDSHVKQSPSTSKGISTDKKSQNVHVPTQAPLNDKRALKKTPTLAKTASDETDKAKVLPTEKVLSSQSVKSSNKIATLAPIDLLSKGDKITATTRPKRNCRLQSALEKSVTSDSSLLSSFNTPTKGSESSLIVDRPKRICKLPSKLADHLISPSKFIPLHPSHASTPIIQRNTKSAVKVGQKANFEIVSAKTSNDKYTSKSTSKRKQIIKKDAKASFSSSSEVKSSPDSNNNGEKRATITKSYNLQTKLHTKQISPQSNKKTPYTRKFLDKNLSFRVLEDNQDKRKDNGLDIYEFTFDPSEEPPPQKKKRKRTIKKKAIKHKTVILKSNYDVNVAKALESLKSRVKPSQPQPIQNNVKFNENNVQHTVLHAVQSNEVKLITKDNPQDNYSVNITPALTVNETARKSIHESNYASIRVEDIAADFELSDHQDINYSPVNSPKRPTPDVLPINENHAIPLLSKDPLNLQDDMSFFDEHPVASSSMNVSVKHPLASPWRVEFGNLPVKWHSDTYVKSNMTPAVESSFICSNSSKKHVYTNIVPDNEPLPEIIASNTPNLKQPSIISFMKEAAERSANKKKRQHSPVKVNSIFEDIYTASDSVYKTPKKAKLSKDATPNTSDNINDRCDEKENSNKSSNKSALPQKTDKDHTYFGFDDSENLDQENISPVQNILKPQTRGLRPRPVLQDSNAQSAQPRPARVVMPVSAKAKLTSSEVVDKLYNQLKSTEDAQFPEKESAKKPADNIVNTIVDDPSWHIEKEDSDSVHLFEDIEVVHHLKPHRKSYGKAKKVAFDQHMSNSDSDSHVPVTNPLYSSDDDLADLTFQMPNVKQRKVVKKKKPKKQLSKKEEKEVEEWAAGFNSMCEDIDDFPLVVE